MPGHADAITDLDKRAADIADAVLLIAMVSRPLVGRHLCGINF
jgi:hypothetical protein